MLDSLREERLRKLRNLQALKFDVYPATSRRTTSISGALKSFWLWSKVRKKIYLVGRIKSIRDQGKIMFLTIADQDEEIQVVVQDSNIEDFKIWKDSLDVGDFIDVYGILFKTKRGERSIEARRLWIVGKTLLPIPSEFYGVHNIEIRLRKRYLELLTYPKSRELFKKKNVFWQTIREFLTARGFSKLETPVMEATPGGADAEPFITHHQCPGHGFLS